MNDNLANAAYLVVLLMWGGAIAWACREPKPTTKPAPAGQTVWNDAAQKWLVLPAGVEPGPCEYTAREVAALDELVLAWQEPAFDPATDPQWAAARARLLADLNNDQHEGEL